MILLQDMILPKNPSEKETEYESEKVEAETQTALTPKVTTFNTLHEKKILEAEQLRTKVCSLESRPQETKREYYAKLAQRKYKTLTEDTEQLMDLDKDLEDDFLQENPPEETLNAEPRNLWRHCSKGLILGTISGLSTLALLAALCKGFS